MPKYHLNGHTNVLGPFIVPVNYDAAHREQIEAVQFDWVPNYEGKPTLEDPTEHLFPLPSGTHEQRLLLVYPNRQLLTEGVLSEMQQRHARPAMSMETLALTRMLPKTRLPLVSLGSVWVVLPHRRREVLYQSEDSDGRYADLRWHDSEWCSCCCFAAVLLDGATAPSS